MIMIMVVIGHKCVWGTVWEEQQERGEKERILRSEEDGNTLHIHI
jgi:hypothetical protein